MCFRSLIFKERAKSVIFVTNNVVPTNAREGRYLEDINNDISNTIMERMVYRIGIIGETKTVPDNVDCTWTPRKTLFRLSLKMWNLKIVPRAILNNLELDREMSNVERFVRIKKRRNYSVRNNIPGF